MLLLIPQRRLPKPGSRPGYQGGAEPSGPVPFFHGSALEVGSYSSYGVTLHLGETVGEVIQVPAAEAVKMEESKGSWLNLKNGRFRPRKRRTLRIRRMKHQDTSERVGVKRAMMMRMIESVYR